MTNDYDHMMAIIQAAKDGKKIEWRHKRHASSTKWFTSASGTCTPFDFSDFEYRIKPEPRVLWINEYAGEGLGRCYYMTENGAGVNRDISDNFIRTVKFVEAVE